MWFMRGVSRQQNTLTIDDAELLGREAQHLTAVVPEMGLREQVKSGNRNLNVSVTGTTPNYADVQAYELAAGRMFSAADDAARRRVAVVGAEVPGMLDLDARAILGRSLLIRAVPKIACLHENAPDVRQRFRRKDTEPGGRHAKERVPQVLENGDGFRNGPGHGNHILQEIPLHPRWCKPARGVTRFGPRGKIFGLGSIHSNPLGTRSCVYQVGAPNLLVPGIVASI